ncbi:MAG: hypothetical protein K8R54_03295 [Bacteroidales bacterium]|nr:hypothetical protein [Bacteroidales bacterium]
MKNIKIKGSLLITFLTRVEAIWALVILVTQSLNNGNKMENILQINSWSYWIFQILSAIAIFIFAYYLLSKIYKIKEQLRVTEIISTLRTKNLFVLHFDNIETYKAPDESNEEYFKRLPDGKFKEYLINEQNEVKKIVIELLDKSPTEAEKLLDGVY